MRQNHFKSHLKHTTPLGLCLKKTRLLYIITTFDPFIDYSKK
jgi:hypothetical protein